jgi:hypothetical protein
MCGGDWRADVYKIKCSSSADATATATATAAAAAAATATAAAAAAAHPADVGAAVKAGSALDVRATHATLLGNGKGEGESPNSHYVLVRLET